MLRSMDPRELAVICDFLDEERAFYKAATLPTGQLWDYGWLPTLSNPDKGYGYELAPHLFEVYTENLNTLRIITEKAVDEIPALQTELRFMGELFTEYTVPTKELIGDALSHRRKWLSVEERAKISADMIPVRNYMDYRNGFNSIRTQHFRVRKPVACLVKEYHPEMEMFVETWHGRYYIPNVAKFGYVAYCAVDGMEGSVLPEVIESDDPTKPLREKTPKDGLRKVLFDKSRHEKIENMIGRAIEHKRQGHRHCNVNNLRLNTDYHPVRNFTKSVRKQTDEILGDEGRIKRIEENLMLYPASNKNMKRNGLAV